MAKFLERIEKEVTYKNKIPLILAILIGIIVFLLITMVALAKAESINMEIIAFLESTNNINEYNDESKATGLYQITPICLEDYNDYHDIKYGLKDLYNKEINEKVAIWYIEKRIPQLLKSKNLEISTENILICYHTGITRLVDDEIPLKTIEYIKDYNRLNKEAKK